MAGSPAGNRDLLEMADRVAPVPESIVPKALRGSPGSVNLFKDEFRGAQRMRDSQGMFIPEVHRTNMAPAGIPRDASAFPPPSYVLPLNARPQTARHPAAGGLPANRPLTATFSKGSPSKPFDWSETHLNQPGAHYTLVRPNRSSPERIKSAAAVADTAQRPASALAASFKSRIQSAVSTSRPATSNGPPPPLGSTVASRLASAASKPGTAPLPPHGPVTVDLGNFGLPPNGVPCSMDAHMSNLRPNRTAAAFDPLLPSLPRGTSRPTTSVRPLSTGTMGAGDFVVDVPEDEFMDGEDMLPRGSTARGGSRPYSSFGASGSARQQRSLYDSAAAPGGAQRTRVGLVEVAAAEQVLGAVRHVRAASASLRKYAMHTAAASSLSTNDTTYARQPAAVHLNDPSTVTPSERIAANFTLTAQGLSPRTLEYLGPAGIRATTAAAADAAADRWHGVDEPELQQAADVMSVAATQQLSFLPLELFDNYEYEDRQPEDWVQLGGRSDGGGGGAEGTPAETKVYDIKKDAYEWEPCSVVRWDAEQRCFEVLYQQGAKRKLVKRLNLRFADEDVGKHEARVAAARANREEAETQLRYHLYVDSVEEEAVVDTYNFASALERAAAQVRGLSHDVKSVVGPKLAADANDFYRRAVKRAVVEYRRLDPFEEARMRVLRLPARRDKPPAPHYAMLPLTADDEPVDVLFDDLLYWARNMMFAANAVVLRALGLVQEVLLAVGAQQLWCLSPVTRNFQLAMELDEMVHIAEGFVEAQESRPPYEAAAFAALQAGHLRRVLAFINLKLTEAQSQLTAGAITELLSGGAPMAEASAAAEAVEGAEGGDGEDAEDGGNSFSEASPRTTADDSQLAAAAASTSTPFGGDLSQDLWALYKHTALKMQSTLQRLVLDSADAYMTQLERYIRLAPVTFDDRRGAAASGSYGQIQEVYSLGALLNAHVVLDADNALQLVPSAEALSDLMINVVAEMAEAVTNVNNVFLHPPPQVVPLLTEQQMTADASLSQCAKRVSLVAQLATERAQNVVLLFEEAAAALCVNMEELLEELAPMDTPLAQYAQWIGKFRSAAAAAARAAPSEVWTGVICVDTLPVKQALQERAAVMIGRLLDQLAAKTVSASRDIVARCSAMQEQLLQPCETTQALMDAKEYLTQCEQELREHVLAELAASREREGFLQAYRHALADDEFALATAAASWPNQLHAAFGQAGRKQVDEELALQRQLRFKVEDLGSQLQEAALEVASYKEHTSTSDMAEIADMGNRLMARLQAHADAAAGINAEEALFEWPVTEWPKVGELIKELEPFASLWNISQEFHMRSEQWLHGPFTKLDPEHVEASVMEWLKKIVRLSKSLTKAEQKELAEETRGKLELFRGYLPIILCVCNPGMRARHWQALDAAAGIKVDPSKNPSLSQLLKEGVKEHEEKLQDISDNASREHSLERQLDKMQAEWNGVVFELLPWRNTGGFILKGSSMEEAQMLLDDHLLKSQAMMSSPAATPFLERITQWKEKLEHMQLVFDAWITCQTKWMYLGPVYGSEEIAKQMPRERQEFTAADGKWRKVMNSTLAKPEVVSITDTEGLLEDLQVCNKAFGVIEKSLNAYLDTKKLIFPRFFFLSNEELLEILSESRDPLNVQPFVKKCFEAVRELEFGRAGSSSLAIKSMISLEGEKIPLDTAVDPTGETNGVERWMLALQSMMQQSMHSIIAKALDAYAVTPRQEWILQWPGQVAICVGQVYWTSSVADAIVNGGRLGLSQLASRCTEELTQEVMLVRGELTSLQRATMGALVVIDVHARDVVEEMVADEVASLDDFSWQSRLRYYWEDDQLVVKMLNAVCYYGYEYLGNSSRLVITPLTDRCYRTLLGAHHLNLGGAPAGPAGTGKTETTKDLAKAVAIQCVVFNCSDGLDYIAMGKFFKGLAASGAWACFDEFNRIELEVLSVVAQQVLTIQRAKAAKRKRFTFEGVDLPLVLTCNVFITMNPGYAGRSELPDNLKALFRDVAMMVPDYAMISEIILYSYGYLDARSLAQKLVQTYRLCSEQLSRQDHYDYGMRAVVAVLRAAGNLKRRMPNVAEDVLMLRAINDVNLPKFLDQDVPLFNGILSDLFPGIDLPVADYSVITAALADNARKAGLQPLPSFIIKAIQLYEMIVVRHGLMLVGQSFGMKTAAIRVLAAALTDMAASGKEAKVKTFTLNPKSITLGQLYGQDDSVSKEWTDGVLAVGFRNFARDTSPDRKWIVLDGPVDAIWIENMNTVLDDNKKLCLNSGEIIAMQGLMNMIFEVADLAVASPATVSRCGMVYMQPSLLGWRPVVQSWMQTLPPAVNPTLREHMLTLFDWLVPPCVRLATKDCKQPVPCQEINMVQSLVRLYHAVMKPLFDSPKDKAAAGAAPPPPPQLTNQELTERLDALFLFSLVWSVGASVDSAGRELFSKQLRLYMRGEYDEGFKAQMMRALTDQESTSEFVYDNETDEWATKLPQAVPMKKPLPAEGSVYDWVFDLGSATWKKWMDTVPAQAISPDTEFSRIVVTTTDVVRYSYLIQTCVEAHNPLLVVGPTGTGKSIYINAHLSSGLDRRKWQYMVFNFSAQTSVNMTQDIIDGKLDKRKKGVYGPPLGKHAVIFVDDLNMPQVETYGAQPPIELLRQYMDHGGWYDRQELTLRKLVDIQFVAAMGPPGGGRNPVTNRYTRHFHTVFVTEFDEASKTQIFGTLVSWWFAKSKFGETITALAAKLVSASLSTYTAVLQELLPTPAKTHYLFNLRDLSKVFQGMMSVASLDSAEALVRLWVHECMRVFHDRLIDDADREWLVELLRTQTEASFPVKFAKLLARVADEGGNVGPTQLRTLMFGDFMNPGGEPIYDEIKDPARLTAVVYEYLKEYNAASKKPLNLVLFQFALEHVARVCRVLKQPGGHALLVGLGGSGRQSLTRLAAFMEDFHLFQIEISSSYSRSDWQEDLKAAIKHAGEKGKDSVFLFTDSQIVEEAMVEDLSNLLNTGEVPNLFDVGEQITIGENIRSRARAAKMDGSRADLYAFFVQEVKRRLHVVLCFSPVGDAFRERLRKFPSLVTCTTIDWFTAWPDDALQSVANTSLGELGADLGADLKAKLATQCMEFHRSVLALTERYRKEAKRHFYVTPTSYLQLLSSYKAVLTRRQGEMATARSRYEVGLEKLASTSEQVAKMQVELEELKPKLIVSSRETSELLLVIEQETKEADVVKQMVAAEEAKAQEEAAKVKTIKDECEADLAEAMPMYEKAIKALDTLTKNDISEVKGMKSPPAPVKVVMEAVCILKGLPPTKVRDTMAKGGVRLDYWETSKKMLSDMSFLESLRAYDKDAIPDDVIEQLKPYLKNPDFDLAKIKKVSQAAFGLCNWVRAMMTYDKVAKVVKPKKEALAAAEEQLASNLALLADKRAELAAVVAKLDALDAQLDEAKERKAKLEAEVAVCEEKLDRAQKLIGGLGGEKERWTVAAQQIGEQCDRLTGDMLLCSGVIAYLGAFPSDYRSDVLHGWAAQCAAKGIPTSPHFSFIGALGSPVRMRQWNLWGLPKDDLSAANGIIITESQRWPLCIDPQGQANKWIRNMEASNNLTVLKPANDPNYLRHLQTCLPLGIPVLLEGLTESLDASLEPVLLRLTFKQAGVLCVKLGESVVEWGAGFRLYMTTKLRNPHYPPEVCVRACLLNFSITPVGLEDQLLGVVVAKERPDLEAQKSELLVQSANNKRQLKEIEDEILRVLSSSEGNILDDGEAVAILQASKKISDEIAQKQKQAEQTEVAIDRARTAYQPVARHTSVLFFTVAELAGIDPMYQYSLAYFTQLFLRSIDLTPKTNNTERRLQALSETFTLFLYTNICRSLFEKDKLLFAFSLAANLSLSARRIAAPQLRFLLTGAISMTNRHPNPAREWLSEQSWANLCELDALAPVFSGLIAGLTAAPAAWRGWCDSALPHAAELPGGAGSKLDLFQRLLLVRSLAPDKLIPAVQAYVQEVLGAKYVEPITFKLDDIYRDSANSVPLIFVLSPGTDPMADFLKFADEKKRPVESVSLGQGQGPVAEQLIAKGVKEGCWVVLQNCHLAKSFLPRLEVICEKTLAEPGVHPDFRLWLSSYPSDIFPVAVLENGLKITTEPPAGLRAGLEKIFKTDPVTDDAFFKGCKADKQFKSLLFSLAFFHCVVIGRKLYGPVGWNIPYEFNENDLRISMRQLRMFLDTYRDAPLVMLQYTCGECNYGGKVTDSKDRRTLMTLLEDFYHEDIMFGSTDALTEDGRYVVPDGGTYDSYLDYIRSLPMTEEPVVFGLHSNANITRALKDTRLMLDSLMLTLGNSSTATAAPPPGGKDSKTPVSSRPASATPGGAAVSAAAIAEVAAQQQDAAAAAAAAPAPEEQLERSAREILDKLPPDFDLDAAEAKYPVIYLESMNTVLCQELARANVLLRVIRTSLHELLKALKGQVVMSAELEKVSAALLSGKVPAMWLAKSFPSLKPLGAYMKEVLDRCAFFTGWVNRGPPVVFWISGFFFTQAFLTGAKQNYARKHKIPIDLIDFDFEVKDGAGECDAKPPSGIFVHGLFLEAAGWDYERHLLCESPPKALFVPMPNMWFKPCRVTDFADVPSYNCPVYKTLDRRGVLSTTGHSTNFVLDCRLPTDQPESFWIKRGVALITSLAE